MTAPHPTLQFMVQGRPIPKARPRRGAYGNWYTPARSAGYADRIAYAAHLARNHYQRETRTSWPTNATYSVAILALVARPWRADADNVVKQVLDACEGILWKNDKLVHDLAIQLEFVASRGRQLLDVWVQARSLAPAKKGS